MELQTDSMNRAEFCGRCLRQARERYRALVASGECPCDARAQALAYLRRKTEWPAALAAGAFDSPDEP